MFSFLFQVSTVITNFDTGRVHDLVNDLFVKNGIPVVNIYQEKETN